MTPSQFASIQALNRANRIAIERAMTTGNRDYVGRTVAVLHRGATEAQQKKLENVVEMLFNWGDFTIVRGALLHNSEV